MATTAAAAAWAPWVCLAGTPIISRQASVVKGSGRSAAQIERELGIGASCPGRWKRQFAKDGEHAFPGHGRLTPDQERIHQLERENEILRQERDILKKAVAIFSHPRR